MSVCIIIIYLQDASLCKCITIYLQSIHLYQFAVADPSGAENLANLYAGALFLEGWRPLLREILDPPLVCIITILLQDVIYASMHHNNLPVCKFMSVISIYLQNVTYVSMHHYNVTSKM